MVVPSLRSVAHAAATLGGDPVVAKPTGATTGDWFVAVAVNAAAATWTPPAGQGWTQPAGSLGGQCPIWLRAVDSDDTARTDYTFAVSGASNNIISLACIKNTLGFDEAKGYLAGSGNAIIPTATSAGADRFLFQMAFRTGTTSFTPPASALPELWDTTVGPSNYTTAGGGETVGAGATGTRTWVPANSTGGVVGYMVLFTPVPPEEGTFSGSYDFTGSGFTGDAPVVPPNDGTFSGGYDFSGSSFVGVAGAPSAYGSFNGGYDFSSDGVSGFTGSAPSDGEPFTPGGRDRFTVRRTPKNRRRSR